MAGILILDLQQDHTPFGCECHVFNYLYKKQDSYLKLARENCTSLYFLIIIDKPQRPIQEEIIAQNQDVIYPYLFDCLNLVIFRIKNNKILKY